MGKKYLYYPGNKHEFTEEEALVLTWICLATHGHDLPSGCSTAVLARLRDGGKIRPSELATMHAVVSLWTLRSKAELSRRDPWSWDNVVNQGKAIRDMLDLADVTYEDRRSDKYASAYYRNGRCVTTSEAHYLDKTGAKVSLSLLKDVPAFRSVLLVLRKALLACKKIDKGMSFKVEGQKRWQGF